MNVSIEIVGSGPAFDAVVEHVVAHVHEWRDPSGLLVTSVSFNDLGDPRADRTESKADFILHVREARAQQG